MRGNKGARTAGVDGQTAVLHRGGKGVEEFLDELRSQLKDRSFRPLPVRERMIPKAGGKLRRWGSPTVRDRVVQASLKLVLEPIFEADFLPCSYGFRPKRRAHDAVAEVRHLTSHSYEWIVEGDIKACFDEISHPALMDRVRERVGDKRVLALVKAFLKAGILGEDGVAAGQRHRHPAGSILSPLLSNVALSVLDEHIAQAPAGPAAAVATGQAPRVRGLPNYRLVRYADDWCLVVSGTRGRRRSPAGGDRGGLVHDGSAPVAGEDLDHPHRRGPRLPGLAHPASPQTRHQPVLRLHLPGTQGRQAVTGKVKTLCRQMDTNQPLEVLLLQLNQMLRGWCAYFRPGVSSATFAYLSAYTWARVIGWLRRKHRRITGRNSAAATAAGGWWPGTDGTAAVQPGEGAHHALPIPGSSHPAPWPVTG